MSWKEEDNQLIKTFTLDNFSSIMSKLPELGKTADSMNHHPDFDVFGYKNIRFKLTTHSENAITQKDYDLADKIDELFE